MTADVTLILFGGTILLLLFAGAYIGVMAYSYRKVAEANKAKVEEVEKSERKYRGLFENSVAGMIALNIETGGVIQSNHAIRTIFEVGSEEELQLRLKDWPGSVMDVIMHALRTQGAIVDFQTPVRKKSGAEGWVLLSGRVVSEDTALAVMLDVTERVKSEEKILEQNALLDQTQDAVMVTDSLGRITYWNSGAQLTYGWGQQEVIDGKIKDRIFTDSKGIGFDAIMDDIRQVGEWSGELHHVRKDGKLILVESRWKAGETAQGKEFILIVSSDITEKRRIEHHLLRAQKMESIALLTGGIAHDLQNILAPVHLSTRILRPKLSDDSSIAVINAVEESVESGLGLLRNILAYGKGITGERAPVKVGSLLDQALSGFIQTLPEGVSVIRSLDGQRWQVSGDANQLKEVFINLLANARDAMGEKGNLRVEAEDIPNDEGLLEHYPDAESGPYVRVTIADTGEGIPEENLDKIFEPFFTTKEGKGGTGLGLSIASGIVKSHDGFLTVESRKTGGTIFRVHIPALKQAV